MVSEWISGRPLIGNLLTRVTFWSERAARISSSFSAMGTPKITPLKIEDERGRVQEISLTAMIVALRRSSCCCLDEG
jgi:hypothetical protein